MGFYGNITNTSRTQFQFDKTFPNRKVMDNFIGTDGVYIGRYVLVEYDKALAADWTTVAYKKTVDGVVTFYTSPLMEEKTRILYGTGNIQAGKYIKIPGAIPDVDGKYVYYDLDEDSEDRYIDSIYEILSSSTINQTPEVKNITKKDPLENDYIINFNIDRAVYGGGRGYDSTVWQKVYADGIERYVMIAELNSVVPTFSVSADAPTMSPIAPHFDVDSTNIFYRVHWQPSWGLRVKSAAPSIKTDPIDDAGKTIIGGTKVSMSTEIPKKLPSDETTIWTRAAYDTSKNQQLNYYYRPATINKDTLATSGYWLPYNGGIPAGTADVPAAIYYNKAGFDPAYISYSEEGMADKITIEPTGLSGHQYNVHDATSTKTPQVDTQELSIMLPSLGNSLAKIWDLIYGGKEVNHGDKVFAEGEKISRNTYIEWTEGSIVPNTNGLRLVTKTNTGYGYEPNQAETLAGAINSVHDLMGMIIQEKPGVNASVSSSTISKWGEDYIYYLPDEDRYYKKHKTYSYPDSVTGSFTKKNYYTQISSFSTWPSDGYYYADYAETNLAQPGGTEVYPNYIKEKVYDPDKTYYKTINVTGNPITEFAGGSFEPYKFFVSVDNISIQDDKGENLSVSAYRISQDKTFNPKSGYLKITHKTLPTNTRFWNKEEKYYTAEFVKVNNPTQNQLDSKVLFILKDGIYTRATSGTIESGVTYYTPESFSRALTFDSNKQHFMVSKKTQGDIVYIETIYYEKFTYTVTANNFADVPRYVWNGSAYVLAESFTSGTTYYEEKIILTPTQGEEEVKPENIIEVTLKNIEEAPEIDGVKGGIYAQYAPKSYSGFDQYYVLNLNNCYRLTSNLVIIYITTNLEIYQPNLYYYQIKDEYEPVDVTASTYKADTHYYVSSGNYILGTAYSEGTQYYIKHDYQGHPLYGSYIFDSNAQPTAGRNYYAATSVGPGESLNYSSTPIYEPFKYYYSGSTSDTNYILSTSKTPVTGKIYWKRTGLYVKSDTNGVYPIGMEWNMNATTVPSGVTLSKRNEVWELQELKGFARHFNTIHGLILRMNSALESNNELIRDYETVQGVINKMKDLIVQFGEIYPNQIAVTDQYGRITTTTFKDDDWIYTNYSNDSAITINHQYIGTDSTKGKTLTVSGETANKTLTFGGTFTSPSFSLKTDTMGHANEFSTSSKTITMPTLEFTEDTSGNVVTNMTMSAGSGSSKVTFTETRENVGTLALTGYTTPSENVTGITASDTINSAFTKVNTVLSGLDSTMTASANNYVSAVTQANGKISVTTAATTTITQLGTITKGVWNGTQIATAYIADGAIATAKLANTSVTSDKLGANSVITAKIADGAVTTAKLADGAVTSAKIADGTIVTADMADGAITNAKVASGIAGSKISMSGYAIGTTAKQSVATTDTLLAAIAKLEKRIADLEAAATV